MSPKSRDSNAQELFERLEEDPDNGPLANELLREFFGDFPVENLCRLLRSHDERVVKAGVWLASELGVKSRPILGEVSKLLGHRSEYVRYFAIDCVLSASNRDDGELIATAISLLRDPSAAVRRKMMDFLARVPVDRLSSTLKISGAGKLKAEDIEGIELLTLARWSPDRIRDLIESRDPIRRRYGASAAARIYKDFEEPLHFALKCDDEDLRTFADDVISENQ